MKYANVQPGETLRIFVIGTETPVLTIDVGDREPDGSYMVVTTGPNGEEVSVDSFDGMEGLR